YGEEKFLVQRLSRESMEKQTLNGDDDDDDIHIYITALRSGITMDRRRLYRRGPGTRRVLLVTGRASGRKIKSQNQTKHPPCSPPCPSSKVNDTEHGRRSMNLSWTCIYSCAWSLRRVALPRRDSIVRDKDGWMRRIFGDPSETRMRGVYRR